VTYRLHVGDWIEQLRTLPDESVHCCVTSPPYWGLRDYGVVGQCGLEASLAEFLAKLVAGFEEVRRVLRKDGTCWVNMGDCYVTKPHGTGPGEDPKAPRRKRPKDQCNRGPIPGLKPKDMVGQPWRLAFALQDAGWYLRRDIIWHKTNPMPETVHDRPATAHEYVFLLTKSARYHYDADAVRERVTGRTHLRGHGVNAKIRAVAGWDTGPGGHNTIKHSRIGRSRQNASFSAAISGPRLDFRNRRSVWTIPCAPFKGAHFATYPERLVEPCILAGCPRGGVVLDPFTGSGTTGAVALRLGRSFVGIELNPQYAAMADRRLTEAWASGVQEHIEGVV
jgi:DNA modification methylase